MSSTRSSKRAHDLAVDGDRPVAHRLGVACSRATTLCTTIVYCCRSSSASANRNGSSSWRQNSSSVQKNDVTSRWRAATSGLALGSSRTGGAKNATDSNGPAGRPSRRVAGGLVVAEVDVGVVEEQQVLALDVEDERLGVGRLGPEHARVEQAVEQERGVGGLGGHARHAADVDVGAAGAVEELEVEVEGLVVAGQPGGQQLAHLREQQGVVALGAGRLAHLLARQRRHEDLGLEPGGQHLGGLADLGGQHAVGDEEDVAVEPGALVRGPHLRDDARDAQRLAVGQHAVDHHDVVELQVGALADPDPELERGGRLGADDPARDRRPGPASRAAPGRSAGRSMSIDVIDRV